VVNGFIVVDKPVGLSSHDVVNRVRRLVGSRRVGHTGTLDPFATGVLPVAINEGTKAIHFLDEGEKGYEATIRLGIRTDTLDHTGTVLAESDCSMVTESDLVRAISGFTGAISQLPPMYSAIKQGGQPLYKLARKGVEVERQSRDVTIHEFTLQHFKNPRAVVTVRCSRGTYIRTLADDLGAVLGCGAMLETLRRTFSGPFRIQDAVTLERLAEIVEADELQSLVVTPSRALCHLPEVNLSAAGVAQVRHGMAPRAEHLESLELPVIPDGLCRLLFGGELVAVAAFSRAGLPQGRFVLERVFNG
jgi:tRNA pseudouridine55 synthase